MVQQHLWTKVEKASAFRDGSPGTRKGTRTGITGTSGILLHFNLEPNWITVTGMSWEEVEVRFLVAQTGFPLARRSTSQDLKILGYFATQEVASKKLPLLLEDKKLVVDYASHESPLNIYPHVTCPPFPSGIRPEMVRLNATPAYFVTAPDTEGQKPPQKEQQRTNTGGS